MATNQSIHRRPAVEEGEVCGAVEVIAGER
jgi:hypothetical protein